MVRDKESVCCKKNWNRNKMKLGWGKMKSIILIKS